jgi:hypothetical protein
MLCYVLTTPKIFQINVIDLNILKTSIKDTLIALAATFKLQQIPTVALLSYRRSSLVNVNKIYS